jgi:hypothetical protein
MNTTISVSSLNHQQNGNKICCICLEQKSVDIPLINCDHRHEFCNECILQWFAMKKFDCPICRKVWQEKECVSQMNIKLQCFLFEIFQSDTSSQNDGHLAVSLESLSSSIVDNTYQAPITYFGIFYPTVTSPSTRARRQMYSALICYLCSFFIVIVVYTILILLSKKFEHKV